MQLRYECLIPPWYRFDTGVRSIICLTINTAVYFASEPVTQLPYSHAEGACPALVIFVNKSNSGGRVDMTTINNLGNFFCGDMIDYV